MSVMDAGSEIIVANLSSKDMDGTVGFPCKMVYANEIVGRHQPFASCFCRERRHAQFSAF